MKRACLRAVGATPPRGRVVATLEFIARFWPALALLLLGEGA